MLYVSCFVGEQLFEKKVHAIYIPSFQGMYKISSGHTHCVLLCDNGNIIVKDDEKHCILSVISGGVCIIQGGRVDIFSYKKL